jgi:hypothetical protein
VMGRFGVPNPCSNLNHRRASAPVGHCPQCGDVVNARIRAQPCNETQHAAARRDRAAFCVHCGTQLIFSR